MLDLLAKPVRSRARTPRRAPHAPAQTELFEPAPDADELEAEIAGIVRDAQRNGEQAERVMERIVTAASLRNEQEPPRRVPVEPDDSFGVTGI